MNDFDLIILICFIAFVMYVLHRERCNKIRFESLELHEKVTDLDVIKLRAKFNDFQKMLRKPW